MKTRIRFGAVFVMLTVISLSCGSGSDDDDSDDDADSTCEDMDTPDGTWVDSESCLMWQVENSPRGRNFDSAEVYCESLELGGFVDWRIPSISEMRSLIRGCPATVTGGDCPLTDECQDGCWEESCRGCEAWVGPTDGCYGPTELPNLCGLFWWTANIEICARFDTGGLIGCNIGDDEHGMSWHVLCVRDG